MGQSLPRGAVLVVAWATLFGGVLTGCAEQPEATTAAAVSTPRSTATFTPLPDVLQPGATDQPATGGVIVHPSQQGPLDGKVVVVDPGHNGAYAPRLHNARVETAVGNRKCMESGTENLEQPPFPEHTVNWQISQRLVPLLTRAGATVLLTRVDDTGVGPCNNVRAELTNAIHADLLISIHADGQARGQDPRGFHVQVDRAMLGGQPLVDRSLVAAQNVVKEMVASSGIPIANYIQHDPPGVWARTKELAVLSELTVTPGVLVEVGNMRSSADNDRMRDPEGQQAIAGALAAAISETLLTPAPMSEPPSPSAPAGSPSAEPTPG